MVPFSCTNSYRVPLVVVLVEISTSQALNPKTHEAVLALSERASRNPRTLNLSEPRNHPRHDYTLTMTQTQILNG